MTDTRWQPVDELIGGNLRRIRKERQWPRSEVASRMSELGFRWQGQTVSTIERGVRPLAVKELLVLPYVLDINPRDLLEGDGGVEITDELKVWDPAELQKAFNARPRPVDPDEYLIVAYPEEQDRTSPADARLGDLLPFVDRWWSEGTKLPNVYDVHAADRASRGDAEVKAAARLGVTPIDVALLAFRTWGHSLTDERERFIAEDVRTEDNPRSVQAVRGHVTRQLVAQLAELIDTEKAR